MAYFLLHNIKDQIMSEKQSPNHISDAIERSVLELPTDKKIDVALAQLSERYTALHNMRDRSMQFTIWILGLGLALGWLLLSEIALTRTQSGILVLFLICIFLASRHFLRGIHKGFENNMKIALSLERALLLLEPGAYLESKAILDEKFADKKQPPPGNFIDKIKNAMRCTEHFFTLDCLLVTVFMLLFLLTIANPCGRNISQENTQQPVPQNKTTK